MQIWSYNAHHFTPLYSHPSHSSCSTVHLTSPRTPSPTLIWWPLTLTTSSHITSFSQGFWNSSQNWHTLPSRRWWPLIFCPWNAYGSYLTFDLWSELQGEISLGEKGFKELVKGMTKSSGALQVRVYSLTILRPLPFNWEWCMNETSCWCDQPSLNLLGTGHALPWHHWGPCV